jgi:ubiquinone/menaquinone biosynthesis C-methylase UbiE
MRFLLTNFLASQEKEKTSPSIYKAITKGSGFEMDNQTHQWDELSSWYDAKQGDDGDLWHRALIDPVLIKLVGKVQGKYILDLGCGNGYLSRRFSKEGAKVSAVDSSASMVERAKSHDPSNKLGITYFVSSSSDLHFLSDGYFDIVFANMSLMDIEDAEGTIKEVARVLSKHGRFVASISHPCFDNGRNSSWVLERILQDSGTETRMYRKIRAYRTSSSEEYAWKISPDERSWTRGYHRPLNWYSKVYKSCRLAIMSLEEPEPSAEFLEKESDGKFFQEIPLHLVIEAIKI